MREARNEMADPYRMPEDPEESATMKVVRDAEREMFETFARILSTTDPRDFGPLVNRLDRLAHERCLGIRLETMRRMRPPGPFAFVVTADGMIERVVPQGGTGDG